MYSDAHLGERSGFDKGASTSTNLSSEPAGERGSVGRPNCTGRCTLECRAITPANDLGGVICDGIIVNEASVERCFRLELYRLRLHRVVPRRIVHEVEHCESGWDLGHRPVRKCYANKVLAHPLDIDKLDAKSVNISLSYPGAYLSFPQPNA